MKSVFISHSRFDQEKARALADAFRKERVNVYLADDAFYGQDWHAEIMASIRRSHLFVAFLDDLTPNVMLELGCALGASKEVFLIASREARIPADIASLPISRLDFFDKESFYWLCESLVEKINHRDGGERFASNYPRGLRNLLENPSELDKMSGEEFEREAKEYFFSIGLNVLPHDARWSVSGYDFIVVDGLSGAEIPVELKKYSINTKVGLSSVYQLLGSMSVSGYRGAILLTTGSFSASALNMARKAPTPVWAVTLEELVQCDATAVRNALSLS